MPEKVRELPMDISVKAQMAPPGMDLVPISVRVNGRRHELLVESRTLLVDMLREQLDLTGTHVGCDTSYCGACTVLLDGKAVKSCTVFAVQADGAEITTVEGLARDGELHPLQKAFADCHGLQCGYCTPGFLMSCTQLLAEHPQPTDEEILKAIAGNTCRCTGYQNILKAIHSAAPTSAKTGQMWATDAPQRSWTERFGEQEGM